LVDLSGLTAKARGRWSRWGEPSLMRRSRRRAWPGPVWRGCNTPSRRPDHAFAAVTAPRSRRWCPWPSPRRGRAAAASSPLLRTLDGSRSLDALCEDERSTLERLRAKALRVAGSAGEPAMPPAIPA